MPGNWLYNCFSDDESLNESMNFDSVIFMKECTSVGSQTLQDFSIVFIHHRVEKNNMLLDMFVSVLYDLTGLKGKSLAL
jgi:hypothetical protein